MMHLGISYWKIIVDQPSPPKNRAIRIFTNTLLAKQREIKRQSKYQPEMDMVAHVYNPKTQEAEAGRLSPNSRPA